MTTSNRAVRAAERFADALGVPIVEATEVEVFTLPADPGEADDLAGELGELVTSCEWKRAAIVYARVRVEDGRGGDPATRAKVKNDIGDKRLTPTEFALLGIHGLKSRTTIRRYWQCWDDAITEGLAQPVTLGDDVELPDAEWADYYTSPQSHTTPPYYCPDGSGADLSHRIEGEVYEPRAAASYQIEVSNRNNDIRCQLAAVTTDEEEDDEESEEGKREDAFRDIQSKIWATREFLEMLASAFDDVELTSDQRAEVEKQLDQIANQFALLRAKVSSESIDDELRRLTED